MIFARVASEVIDPAEVLARVGSARDGATLLFLGVVRDHADDRPVSGMRYDAYQEMASEVLRTIAEEAAGRLGTDHVAVVHRFGELAIGDVSVAIAVSSPHRAEAYKASRHVIEEIKERLPVWKKEHYVDGASEWVAGTVPPGTAAGMQPGAAPDIASGAEAAAVGQTGDDG
jgi:molybdopterin synthase catalytic subunit